ncbi:MAG: UPF0182 family protein [Longimicrobiales bacterium]|nr:UPF0182 family protein [Longimicrobiales bacterium]
MTRSRFFDTFLASLRGGRLVLAAVVAVTLLLILARIGTTLFTEILWHAEAGYSEVFWTRIVWQWGARVLGGLLVAVLVFVNLRIVSATLGGIQIKRRFGNLEISEQLPRSYIFWSTAGLSAMLAAWFGAAVPPSMGLQALMLVHGEAWGVTEPFLGRDAGFYVFWVPVLGAVITFALVVLFLLFTLATAGYATTGALRWGRGKVVAQDLPRVHLGLLLGAFFLLLGARLWLSRYLLLLGGSSGVQGIFGFTDAQARIPGFQTLVVICVVAGVGIAWSAWKNRGVPLVAAALTTIVATLVIGQFYPALVQRFQVEPNELDRETPYIEASLAFTRAGFGLDGLERRRFAYRPDDAVDWGEGAAQFRGLPVWNRSALLTTFRQLEARFPYYDFPEVSIDRYPSASGPRVVAVSVREVDPAGIQDPNWQNLHLRERYVAGMGVVATLASERTPEGRPPMLLSGIPPEPVGTGRDLPELVLTRPEVFYGARPQVHAVVNPGQDQFLSPEGTPGVAGVDFPAGVQLASWVRTVALAWRFRDANLLFAGEVHSDSRFLYRRQVLERVQAIAPFLRYPEAPYPVVADGRVVWLVEGFTGTRAFPLSTPHELQTLRLVSYARNSIKITVDAVSGRVDFYRVPVEDPLADTYQRAFPGLFKPVEEMPTAVREHLRYSKELLNLQAEVLLQYHQETAQAFHGQQDVWELSSELAEDTNPVAYRPEYGVWKLPGEAEPRFTLSTVFVPSGRQNLTAVLAGRTGAGGVPELVLLDVPVEDQVPGPRQIESLVEQDPIISQEFSLWRTGGSEVWTGHLHVVPVGRRVLYMEPVFLAAESDAIPELRRFVVSDGVRVSMTEDLAGGIAALAGFELAPLVGASSAAGAPGWPSAALDILNRAESRLREGDWVGFGQALQELRTLLESAGGPGPTPGR